MVVAWIFSSSKPLISLVARKRRTQDSRPVRVQPGEPRL
jgi:hypothetical protein